MNGVEILSTTQVVTGTTHNFTAAWIVAGIIMIICIAAGIFWAYAENNAGCVAICLLPGIVFAAMGFGITIAGTASPAGYETHYKVTISDSVSMLEFDSKYEVLDQEGRIYTVRERAVE